MRLQVDRLPAQLRREGLAPIYLLSGEEPLQRFEAEDAIRSFARTHGVEERVVLDVGAGFHWNSIRQATSNLSLFSNKRLIELRLATQKPGKEGGQALAEYAAHPNADTVLLISADKMEKRTQQTAWFKALEKAGAILQTRSISLGQLPEWIVARCRDRGKTITPEAAHLIAQCVEGNLLAAKQEIDKLCLLVANEHIDVQQTLNAVTENARYTVFALIESAFAGQTERTLRMLKGLRSEGVEPMALHGAIMWEFRRVCSMAYQIKTGLSMEHVLASFHVWGQRKPAIVKFLERHGTAQLHAFLHKAIQIEHLIKSNTRANVWDEFSVFLLSVAGTNLPTNKLRDYY